MKSVSDWPNALGPGWVISKGLNPGMNVELSAFKFHVVSLFLHNLVTIINFLVTALQFIYSLQL